MALITFTLSDDGIETLDFNGRTFISSHQTAIFGGVTLRTSGNVDTDYPFQYVAAATTKSHNASSVTHVYTLDTGLLLTIVLTLTIIDRRTLKVAYAISCNDPSRSIARVGTGFEFTCPSDITRRSDGFDLSFPVRLGSVAEGAQPAIMIGGLWGSIAMWPENIDNNGKMFIQSLSANIQLAISNYTPTPDNGDPVEVYEEDLIAPGHTYEQAVFVRWGTVKSTPLITQVCPEAFKSARRVFPPRLIWKNRYPIGLFFIAQYEQSSLSNPRGYLWDNTIDVSDTEAFRAAVVAWMQARVTAYLDTMTHRPQAVIVWDLEGEQYLGLTYAGMPEQLALLAPEMDLVADDLFKVFKDAGYMVGVTLRPGNVDQTPPFSHTQADSQAEAFSTLLMRAQYCYDRWGCRIFYVDTPSVSHNRTVGAACWRDLQAAMPDCLFFPESTPALGYLNAADYRDCRFEGMTPAADVNRRAFVGIGPDTTTLSNPAKYDEAVASVQNGSIMFFSGFWGDPVNAIVDSIYTDAGF